MDIWKICRSSVCAASNGLLDDQGQLLKRSSAGDGPVRSYLNIGLLTRGTFIEKMRSQALKIFINCRRVSATRHCSRMTSSVNEERIRG